MALLTLSLVFALTKDLQRWNQVILTMKAYTKYSLSFWKCLCYFCMLTFEHRERISVVFLAKVIQLNYSQAQI